MALTASDIEKLEGVQPTVREILAELVARIEELEDA